LKVDAVGAIDLNTATNAVGSLYVTGSAGTTFKNSGLLGITAITSTGAVDVEAGGTVTVNGAITAIGQTVGIKATAGDITFNGTIDGGQTLALTLGTGKAVFNENVGMGTALTAVTVAGSSAIDINGGKTIRTTAPIAFGGHTLTLTGTGAVALTSTTGSIALGNVRRDTSANDLTITANTTVDFGTGTETVGVSGTGLLGTITVAGGTNVTVSAEVYAARFLIDPVGTGNVVISRPVSVSGGTATDPAFSSGATATAKAGTFTISHDGSTTSGSIKA
jgi:hypothetical protein